MSESYADALVRQYSALLSAAYERQARDPDTLLLVRRGDAYEVYGRQAEIVADALGLVVLERLDEATGVRVRVTHLWALNADRYVGRLWEQGHAVMIWEPVWDGERGWV